MGQRSGLKASSAAEVQKKIGVTYDKSLGRFISKTELSKIELSKTEPTKVNIDLQILVA
jgi:hypothetical protein